MAQRIETIEVPVLVVGAGPVGLALAADLGWRGVECLCIEQGDGAVLFPAGEAIFVRTMEHLRRWGIARRVLESPFPPDYPRNVVFVTRINGHAIARFDRDSNASAYAKAGAVSPESHAWCPKMWFDPLLAEYARSRPGVDLRYGWKLEGFEQDDEGVTARVSIPAENRDVRVRARYLAACDGGRSSVRRALGIEFGGIFAEGHNYSIYFRARDLLARQPHGHATQFLTLSSRHRSALSTVNGGDLWRLSLYVTQEEAAGIDPMDCIRDAFGAGIDAEILRAQPWSGHRVVAERYRERRVFLAGDAAHMLWPKGGFGAHTGIGDAVDLAWKLEGVLAGWGGERLLESYETERRAIGIRNVDEAASNRSADGDLPSGAELEMPGLEGDALRARAGETIRRTRWKEWNTVGVQLGYRYAGSPVVCPDGTPEPPDLPWEYAPTTWPGCRAPHAWLRPGHSTLDSFGRGYTLVNFGTDGGPVLEAARAAGMPVAELRVSDPAIRALYERDLVLVRPDGHVAWRGNAPPADAREIIDRVRGAASGHPVAA